MRERIGLARSEPVITCQYQVDIEPIFNSLDENDLHAFQIEGANLDCSWEDDVSKGNIPTSHLVAAKLTEAGYAGMLVKSFAFAATSDDVNLVLWDYGNSLPRKIELIHDERIQTRMRQTQD